MKSSLNWVMRHGLSSTIELRHANHKPLSMPGEAALAGLKEVNNRTSSPGQPLLQHLPAQCLWLLVLLAQETPDRGVNGSCLRPSPRCRSDSL